MKLTNIIMILVLLICTCSCVKKITKMQLVTEDYPPLTYEANGNITGYGAEIVKAIQAELKSTDKIKMTDWNTAYETALNEPNVVIFTMEKTPERDTSFYWVGPIGKNKTYFYAKADSKLKINSLVEAKAAKYIATTTDWFSEQYLKKNGFTNLKSNNKPTIAVKLVMSGDAELAAFTDLTVNKIVEQAGYKQGDLIPVYQFLDTDFYIGISKQTSPDVVKAWQKAFDKVKKAGILDKLQAEYLK